MNFIILYHIIMCILCTMDIYTNINNILRDINYLLSITDMKCCSMTNIFPKFLINLQHLNCEQVIHYIELPNSYKNLKSLYCQSAQIYDIPNTFINLEYLDCSYTAINYIPKTLRKLEYLDCSYTAVDDIPNTLIKLEYLDCSYTAVEDIPNTLINLEYLDCSYTEITFIPDTLVLLEYLNCSENIDLNKLPDTLINLITLNCNSTDIIDIPKTLINLTEIYSDKLDTNMIINRQKKIKNGFLKFIKLYKLYRISDTLWKIAEYYIARKYSPNNIIHYIDWN